MNYVLMGHEAGTKLKVFEVALLTVWKSRCSSRIRGILLEPRCHVLELHGKDQYPVQLVVYVFVSRKHSLVFRNLLGAIT